MQTLILNGSPRRGDTAALLDALRRHLDGEVRVFSAYRDAIAPCTDCRYCWHSPGCSIRDGMDEVYACIENFDNVVIASPLYFSQLTGPLLGLGSRLQTYYAARRFRGGPVPMLKKNGVLVLAGGGDGGTAPARSTAGSLFGLMRTTPVAEVLSLKTDDLPAARDTEALAAAKGAALLLNELGRHSAIT